MKRVAVLASGFGSNLEAILEAQSRAEIQGKVVLVISDRRDAKALERAEKRGIKNLFIDPRNYDDRENYDLALAEILKSEEVDLVVLAGFMRLLTPYFIKSFPLKIINIHPSLLPSFPGTDGIEQAYAHGVKVSGCTVHFVDEGLDSGPIILQESVPLIQEESIETLKQRIQALEHRLYPIAIDLFCREKLQVNGRRCYIVE